MTSTKYFDFKDNKAFYYFENPLEMKKVDNSSNLNKYGANLNSNESDSLSEITSTVTSSLGTNEVSLNEVVVKGTRLQIAYRGDTIVYNAAAFNISEGAMLETLVRQLPGAILKSNGDVYLNGQKVDYITLTATTSSVVIIR